MNEWIRDKQALLTIAAFIIAAVIFYVRLEAHVTHLENIENRIEQKVDENSEDISMLYTETTKVREDVAYIRGYVQKNGVKSATWSATENGYHP